MVKDHHGPATVTGTKSTNATDVCREGVESRINRKSGDLPYLGDFSTSWED